MIAYSSTFIVTFFAALSLCSGETYYNQKQQQNSLYCNDLNPQHGVDIDNVSEK